MNEPQQQQEAQGAPIPDPAERAGATDNGGALHASGRGTAGLAISIAVVSILVAAVHWPALSARTLTFDDHQYVVANPLVLNPGWSSTRRFLAEVLEPSTVEGYYQPLTMISLMADAALGGRSDNLMPFHRTSLTLHVMNTALVIVLLYLLFGEPWAAAMVGLLFGVHPITVESIPWLGERKTLLATFFVLWSLILYVRYARTSRWRSYGGCLVFYVLALMAKPTATPLPALLLLLDYWPIRRLGRRAILEKLPLFAIGCASGIITFLSQTRTAFTALPTEHAPLRAPLIVCHNIVFYLRNIFWPTDLSPHYPFPEPLGLSHPMVLAGVVGTFVLLIVLVVTLRFTRALMTGWLFFFVAILPTLGIIGFTNVIASDKFAYLPSVGFLLVLAWLMTKVWRSGSASVSRRASRQLWITVVVMCLATAEGSATRRYLVHWQDTESLCRHMLTLAPRAPVLHYGLGYFLQTQGRLDEAIESYRAALGLLGDFPEAHHGIAVCLKNKGLISEAMTHFEQALDVRSDLATHRVARSFALAHLNYGALLKDQGETARAVNHFNEALRIAPNLVEAHHNLGNVSMERGRLEEAERYYANALRLDPHYAETHFAMGVLLTQDGRTDEAVAEFMEAARIRPDFIEPRARIAAIRAGEGRIDEAIELLAEVLRVRPDIPDLQNRLGLLLAQRNRFGEAAEHFAKTLTLAPDFPDAAENLETARINRQRITEAVQRYREQLRINPDDTDAHYALGLTAHSQGRLDEAIREYEEILCIDPTDVRAQTRLDQARAQRAAP